MSNKQLQYQYQYENCIQYFDTSKFENNITDGSEKVI